MMSRVFFIFLIFSMLVFGACRTPETTVVTPEKPTDESTPEGKKDATSWQMELKITGGFAGVKWKLTLDDQGQLTVQDEKKDITVQSHLSQERLDQVNSIITELASSGLEDRDETDILEPCPDCFQYTLKIVYDGQRCQVVENDETLSESPYQTLMMNLYEVIQQALQGELS